MITIDPIKRPSKVSFSVDTEEIMKEIDQKIEDALNTVIPKIKGSFEKDGVYILDSEGNIDNTYTNSNITGILIKDSDYKFVIGFREQSLESFVSWSTTYQNNTLSGVFTTNNSEEALSDFNAVENTAIILENHSYLNQFFDNFSSGIYSREDWVIPSIGYLAIISKYLDEIRVLLEQMGMNRYVEFFEGGILSSTQYDKNNYWKYVCNTSTCSTINKQFGTYFMPIHVIQDEESETLIQKINTIKTSGLGTKVLCDDGIYRNHPKIIAVDLDNYTVDVYNELMGSFLNYEVGKVNDFLIIAYFSSSSNSEAKICKLSKMEEDYEVLELQYTEQPRITPWSTVAFSPTVIKYRLYKDGRIESFDYDIKPFSLSLTYLPDNPTLEDLVSSYKNLLQQLSDIGILELYSSSDGGDLGA